MKKDGIELNMHNKCSSEQKMLASIIIRLALAQTFCSKCPIIALDEPTTNLDQGNMKELANQIAKLASLGTEGDDCGEMSKSRRFQLIVITHNKDFIHPIVNQIGIGDYFHITREIDKNKKHYSKIDHLNFFGE